MQNKSWNDDQTNVGRTHKCTNQCCQSKEAFFLFFKQDLSALVGGPHCICSQNCFKNSLQMSAGTTEREILIFKPPRFVIVALKSYSTTEASETLERKRLNGQMYARCAGAIAECEYSESDPSPGVGAHEQNANRSRQSKQPIHAAGFEERFDPENSDSPFRVKTSLVFLIQRGMICVESQTLSLCHDEFERKRVFAWNEKVLSTIQR